MNKSQVHSVLLVIGIEAGLRFHINRTVQQSSDYSTCKEEASQNFVKESQ